MVDTTKSPLAVPPENIPPAAGVLPKINPYVAAALGILLMAADVVAHVVPEFNGLAAAINGAAIPLATVAFGAAGAAPVVNLAIGAAQSHESLLGAVERNTNGRLTDRLGSQTADIVQQVLDAMAAKDAPAVQADTSKSEQAPEPGAF